MEPMGGKVGARAMNASAYAHRNAVALVDIAAIQPSAADILWSTDSFNSLAPYLSGAYCGYGNTLTANATNYAQKYWGENYPQLQRVKSRFDPVNFFSLPQGIKPSQSDY